MKPLARLNARWEASPPRNFAGVLQVREGPTRSPARRSGARPKCSSIRRRHVRSSSWGPARAPIACHDSSLGTGRAPIPLPRTRTEPSERQIPLRGRSLRRGPGGWLTSAKGPKSTSRAQKFRPEGSPRSPFRGTGGLDLVRSAPPTRPRPWGSTKRRQR